MRSGSPGNSCAGTLHRHLEKAELAVLEDTGADAGFGVPLTGRRLAIAEIAIDARQVVDLIVAISLRLLLRLFFIF